MHKLTLLLSMALPLILNSCAAEIEREAIDRAQDSRRRPINREQEIAKLQADLRRKREDRKKGGRN